MKHSPDLPLRRGSPGTSGDPSTRAAAVFAMLPAVLLGLGVVYLLRAFSHLVLLSGPMRAGMMALAGTTAFLLFLARFLVGRGAIPVDRANGVGAVAGALALTNALAFLALTGEIQQTTNVMLVALCGGGFFLSWFWLNTLLLAVLAGWCATVVLLFPQAAVGHYAYSVVMAVGLAQLFHFARLRGHEQLESLRLAEQRASLLEKAAEKARENETRFHQLTAKGFAQKLHEREALQRAMLESALDCVITIDQKGKVVAFNPAAERTFGYEASQAIGEHMSGLIVPPSLRAAHERGMAHYLATGEGPVLEKRFEITAMRAGGEEFPIELAITPIRLSDEVLFTAYLRDITDRKQSEIELRLRERAMEAAPAGIAISDPSRDGNPIVYVNPGLEALTGYSRDELLGDRFELLLASVADSEVVDGIRTALREERPYVGEFVAYRKDGAPYWNRTSIAPVRNADGKVVNFVSVQDDLTDRKETEDELARARDTAEAANLAKSRFLASVSHEIRTPLNGVIGMTGLLLGTELTSQQQGFGERLRESGELLLRLINDLLDFSKIEAGQMVLEETPFSIRPLMEQVQAPFRPMAEQKGLSFGCQVDPAVPLFVRGDPGRLHQILNNLIGNAFKFTDSGSIGVQVELADGAPEGWTLRCAVADTGIGIPAAAQPTLFDAFTQADTSTSRLYGGTGLGLAIVKDLVELLDGEVGVESEEGKGSRFWFTARFGRVEGEELFNLESLQEEAAGVRVEPQPRGTPRRILVAEDNAINQEVVTAMLQRLGHTVDVVGDGGEAVEAFSRIPYDLIFMDCQMPRVDGFRATQLIRGREGGGSRRVPIVAMTAYAIEGIRDRCLAAGMDGYVSKPVQLESLASVLEKSLPKRSKIVGAPLEAISKDQPAAIDAEVLNGLRALAERGKPDLLDRLIARFLEDTPGVLTAMRDAVEAGAAEGVARWAHDLKSTCGNLGARRMSRLCNEMQEQGRSRCLENFPPLLARIEEEFERVRHELATVSSQARQRTEEL